MNKSQFKAFLKLFVSAVILCTVMQIPAHAQDRSNITLKMSGVTLESVLDTLEKQSGYLFLSNQIELSQKVSVDVVGKSIEKVLDSIFNGKDVTYTIQGINIYISPGASSQRPSGKTAGKVSGTVQDATGWPVIGAAVLIKGSTHGTSTNVDGRFEFDIPEDLGGRNWSFPA